MVLTIIKQNERLLEKAEKGDYNGKNRERWSAGI